MRDLKTTKALVTHILEKDIRARNSDCFLYFKVIEHFDTKENSSILDMKVETFLNNLNALKIPGFETVRRARQKVQAEFPHLSASERVREFRAENEAEFREFARG